MTEPIVAPATGSGRRFERHAFVCTAGTACSRDTDCVDLAADMKAAAKAAGLHGVVRVNKAGCLGQCGHGPMVVVYPEGTWYSHVTAIDGARIVAEHLVGGQPVADLLMHTARPGNNVVPRRGDLSVMMDHPAYEPCTRCTAPA